MPRGPDQPVGIRQRRKGRWSAEISGLPTGPEKKRHRHWLGTFDTKEEAAAVYQQAAAAREKYRIFEHPALRTRRSSSATPRPSPLGPHASSAPGPKLLRKSNLGQAPVPFRSTATAHDIAAAADQVNYDADLLQVFKCLEMVEPLLLSPAMDSADTDWSSAFDYVVFDSTHFHAICKKHLELEADLATTSQDHLSANSSTDNIIPSLPQWMMEVTKQQSNLQAVI